jgi:cytochrome c553
MKDRFSRALLLLPLFAVGLNPASASASDDAEEARGLFINYVRPLLASKCEGCHGAAKVSGYSVLSRDSLISGGKKGKAVVPGQSAASILVTAIEQSGALKMPPGPKLPEKDIAAVKRWIDLGAPWVEANTKSSIPDRKNADLWAFQPVQHYEPPKIAADVNGTLNAVDRFVLRKLNEHQLQIAPRADRRTLIRRAAFDLTGLPPTPEEVSNFVSDPESDKAAFSKLIERLLASPRYGEHWGRHWLDVTRYADTGGYSNDFERPNAWRYREYVIRSFNADKPYNQFVKQQIAGDEMDPGNPENLIATGFLRMGPWEHTAMSVSAETRQAWLDDVTHTTGAAFLGLTIECARCHDHKFDPLPTKDYYSLQAVFATTEFAERPAAFLEQERREDFASNRARLEDLVRKNNARIASYEDLIAQRLAKKNNLASVALLSKEEVKTALRKRDLLSPTEMELLKVFEKRKDLYDRAVMRYEPVAYSVSDGPFSQQDRAGWSMPEVFILPVGNLKTPGEKVAPGVLTALYTIGKQPKPEIPPESLSRRLALANWIADANNPLTARVMVNRIWAYHFGKGIAANPNNLGKMGKPPTHPELLDYLAEQFVKDGWSVKAVHRLIMTSDAYARADDPPDAASLKKEDPTNDLLSFFPPRRLESEEIRDSMLAVAGELSPDTGGPGTFPEINRDVALQPQQIMGTVMPAYRASPLARERNRRTVYTFQKRNLTDPFLEVFDGPSLDNTTEQRIATTIPTQVFALFNSEMAHDAALAFAARIAKVGSGRDERIREGFRLALQREPSPRELDVCRALLDSMTAHHRETPPPPNEARKPVVRGITSELTGTEVQIEEDREEVQYQENLRPADVTADIRALADFALVLFNANEFIYLH